MLSAEEIAIRTAFSIVTVTGVTGNILVCLVVLLNKPMRTPMNYLLVNLAISDMLLLLFFTPTFIFKGAYTHPSGTAGDLLCIFLTGESFAWMGGYASASFLVAIAIERFYAITNPEKHVSITENYLALLVFVCWFVAISWNSIGFAVKQYDEKSGFCSMEWPAVYSFKVYSALTYIVVGVIPIATMCILYSRVVHTLYFKREVVQVNNQEAERNRRKKATKMMLTVSLVYMLSWVPELTIFLLVAYAPQSLNIQFAYPASVAMVTFNSAVNPIIYGFHNERFRRYLVNLVCCKRFGVQVGPVESRGRATCASTIQIGTTAAQKNNAIEMSNATEMSNAQKNNAMEMSNAQKNNAMEMSNAQKNNAMEMSNAREKNNAMEMSNAQKNNAMEMSNAQKNNAREMNNAREKNNAMEMSNAREKNNAIERMEMSSVEENGVTQEKKR